MSTMAAQPRAMLGKVRLEIIPSEDKTNLFTWRITNPLDIAVYVYDVYLWGPAYYLDRDGESIRFDTAPVTELHSCPPNRFPPVLLLLVGPRRTIQGNFVEPRVPLLAGKLISMRISVGFNYDVVEQARRFAESQCKYSPYDAIVLWGTVIESNRIRFPK